MNSPHYTEQGNILLAMPSYADRPLLFLIAYSMERPRQIEDALAKNMNALHVARNLWLHRAEEKHDAADIRDGLVKFLGPGDSLTVFRLTSEAGGQEWGRDPIAWHNPIASNDSIRAIFAGIR